MGPYFTVIIDGGGFVILDPSHVWFLHRLIALISPVCSSGPESEDTMKVSLNVCSVMFSGLKWMPITI